jgi:hypothetical protein
MWLGKLHECYVQCFDPQVNNLTLGVHIQQWLSTPNREGNKATISTLFIGILFFRIVFEFVKWK